MKSKLSFANLEDLRMRIQVFNPQHEQEDVYVIKIDAPNMVMDGFLSNPQKWWPHDLGEQNLYSFVFSLYHKNQLIDIKQINYGFRNIQLHQPKDAFGSEFYFSVDEKPIFARGANLIPFHHFPSEVSRDDYLFYLLKIKEANMNMVRIWGGGIYESELFYRLCDSLGIMVWQDFIFAGTMYPANDNFLQTVNEEITQQIIRIRHHPSLVLWCGNNEISEAWHNWGWQKEFGYSESDSTFLWSEYLTLFEEMIPQNLSQNDSKRPYHPSSPTTGWGKPESLILGDIHYWGVWWGKEDLEHYAAKTGRFVSEYGFQGLPNLSSLKKFIPEEELFVGSASMRSHQKHPTGYETIEHYLNRYFPKPKTLADYIYFSQLLQAKALKTAIESHRLAKPYCMGSLLWQFNDTWPVVSWSLVDFYKSPKPAYFQVKRSFAPTIPIFQQKDTMLYLYIVSDEMKNQPIKVKFQIITFSGKILMDKALEQIIQPEKVMLLDSINVHLFEEMYPFVAYVEVITNNEKPVEELQFFQSYTELKLPKPEIRIKQIDQDYLELESDYVAPHIWLREDNTIFEENFINLLPNKPIRIKYKRLDSNDININSIEIRSFYTIEK